MRFSHLILLLVLIPATPAHAFLGTELAPLFQLVSGQITEIERLTETLGFAKDQIAMVRVLNEGVNRTVAQIQNLKAIVERAQGLDPSSVKSLSDLNDLLYRANQTREEIGDVLQAKLGLADQAIASSAIQSDTAYRMGQEMVVTGSALSSESQTASPGRASQITAAADSAQMLASGVQLQTLAQIAQLQAMTLEFQKGQVEQDLHNSQMRNALYERQLSQSNSQTRRGVTQ